MDMAKFFFSFLKCSNLLYMRSWLSAIGTPTNHESQSQVKGWKTRVRHVKRGRRFCSMFRVCQDLSGFTLRR